ncbi:helix-turn-helix domain-containing protein [Herbidospora sp. RD11066]
MAEKDTVAPHRRRLGQQLRRLREASGKTGAQVAEPLGWSAAKVSRIETAQTLPSEDDITALITAYGADEPALGQVLKLRQDATQKGWWEQYDESLPQGFVAFLGLEAEAEVMRNWEPTVLPGLLQTEDYASALICNHMQPIAQIPKAWLRDRVEVRLRRQAERLLGPNPLRLQVVFEESVLRRNVGGTALMKDQLQHLVRLSELDHVEIRLITASTLLPVITGPFVHFSFSDFPETVYLEDLTGARFVEDAKEVFHYERAFTVLTGVALDTTESRLAIKDAAAFWRERTSKVE